MPIERLLAVSTAHIDPATADRLNNGDMLGIIDMLPHEYGWIVPRGAIELSISEGDAVPTCLVAIVMLARQEDCTWIVIDSDVDTEDSLQTWEW